jgi:hypothetical protein
VTRERPGPVCVEIAFGRPHAVGALGQVALEDYARAMARAEAAEALGVEGDPARVRGLHLCAPAAAPGIDVREDIEAFARELAERAGDGLGWS